MPVETLNQSTNETIVIGDDITTRTLYTIYMVLYSIEMILGISGNLLVITVLLMIKELRNSTNMLILNLAIIDLLLTLVVDLFGILGYVLDSTFFNKYHILCEFVAALCFIFCSASILNLLFLALNRYANICHNKYYDKIFTQRKTVIYIVIIWLGGLLHDSANIAGWGGHIFEIKSRMCIWNRMANDAYSVFFTTVILIPCFGIFLCYVRIFRFVAKSNKRIRNVIESSSLSSSKREFKKSVKVAKALFISYVAMLVCWVPYGLFILFDRGDVLPGLVYSYSTLMVHMYSAINPILYGLFNPPIRKGYRYVFKKLFLKNSRVDIEHNNLSILTHT